MSTPRIDLKALDGDQVNAAAVNLPRKESLSGMVMRTRKCVLDLYCDCKKSPILIVEDDSFN